MLFSHWYVNLHKKYYYQLQFFSALSYPNICFLFYNCKCTLNTGPETRNCISAPEDDTLMGLNSVLGLRLPNMAPGGANDEMVTFMCWIDLRIHRNVLAFSVNSEYWDDSEIENS